MIIIAKITGKQEAQPRLQGDIYIATGASALVKLSKSHPYQIYSPEPGESLAGKVFEVGGYCVCGLMSDFATTSHARLVALYPLVSSMIIPPVDPSAATYQANGTIDAAAYATADDLLSLVSISITGKEDVSNKSTDVTLGGATPSNTLYPSQAATKTYADQLIAAANAVVYKGVIDCSGNPNYPAADAGFLYVVSVAGKIGGTSGVAVEAGDIAICKVDGTPSGDQATVGSNWNAIQKNIDGYVIAPASATDAAIALYDGTTGKLIKDSTKTIVTTLGADDSTVPTSGAVATVTGGKQATLVSGTNIKTINSTDILGSGNISVDVAGAAATAEAAAKAYADTLVVGLLDDRGGFDASVNKFPKGGGSSTEECLNFDRGYAAGEASAPSIPAYGVLTGDIAMEIEWKIPAFFDSYLNLFGIGTQPNIYLTAANEINVAGAGISALTLAASVCEGTWHKYRWERISDVSVLKIDNVTVDTRACTTSFAADAFHLTQSAWTTTGACRNARLYTGTGATTLISEFLCDDMVGGTLIDTGSALNNAAISGGYGWGTILKGDTWTISVAGTLGSTPVNIGDWIRALVDQPGQTAASWAITQGNIPYVAENVANKSTDGTLGGATPSTTLYPSQSAAKTYADTKSTGLVKYTKLTSTSAATFTTQAATRLVKVRGVAAGGGGGGATGTANPYGSGGGGGGAGGYFEYSCQVTPSTGYSYQCGTGGAGGSATGDGADGTDTTITFGGTTITAYGGKGGKYSAPIASQHYGYPGSGGAISTNGDQNSTGCAGVAGFAISSGSQGMGGAGGCSVFGGGMVGANAGTNANGNNALTCGGGGSGAYEANGTTGYVGGNGANGCLIVEEYN